MPTAPRYDYYIGTRLNSLRYDYDFGTRALTRSAEKTLNASNQTTEQSLRVSLLNRLWRLYRIFLRILVYLLVLPPTPAARGYDYNIGTRLIGLRYHYDFGTIAWTRSKKKTINPSNQTADQSLRVSLLDRLWRLHGIFLRILVHLLALPPPSAAPRYNHNIRLVLGLRYVYDFGIIAWATEETSDETVNTSKQATDQSLRIPLLHRFG